MPLALANSLVQHLKVQNEHLKDANALLHKQLKQLTSLSNFTSQIQEDYFYNKKRLQALLEEYQTEPDQLVKAAVASQVLKTLVGLIEDVNMIGGSVESTSTEELMEVYTQLDHFISQLNSAESTKEFQRILSEFSRAIDRKQLVVKSMQKENSELLGNLQVKQGYINQLTQEYNFYSSKVQETLLEKQKLEKLFQEKVDLETTERGNSHSLSSSKHAEYHFKKQSQQNSEIQRLQKEISDGKLRLENLTYETNNLHSQQNYLESKVSSLKRNLEIADSELAQTYKEDFQTRSQIEELNASEETASLQTKILELFKDLSTCYSELEFQKYLESMHTQNLNMADLELSEANKRLAQAQKARDKKLQILSNRVQNLASQKQDLQSYLTQTLEKLEYLKSATNLNFEMFN